MEKLNEDWDVKILNRKKINEIVAWINEHEYEHSRTEETEDN